MKKWWIFLIIIFIAILCRTYLFKIFFTYNVIKERTVSNVANEKLKEKLDNEKDNSIEDIIESSLDETASDLNFTFDHCDNETNKLVESKKANCIGYSAFLASIIKFKLNQNELTNQWKVHHKVGEIYFLNENINKYFDSKFFKDHDFVTVENVETKEVIAIDATIYDYFKINRIRLK